MKRIESCLAEFAANDPRMPLLAQLPGVGLLTAITILAAIGDITRFPDANHLVGYSGLGAKVHVSGLTSRSGGITKAGRKDLRGAMVEAAQVAVMHDHHWKSELGRLEPHIGRNKAIVAIARKMLVIIWHILSKHQAEKELDLARLARKYYEFAYTVGKVNWGDCSTVAAFIRYKLDEAGVGRDFTSFIYSRKRVVLPPSKLPTAIAK